MMYQTENARYAYLGKYYQKGRQIMQGEFCYFAHDNVCKGKFLSFYIAQYPFLIIAQRTLHFSSLADLFTQTPSRLLWEASSHMLQLMREGCSYTYPSLSIARYSFIQLSKLEQCGVKNRAQGFNTAVQDSNPVPLSRESEVLPLSYCALYLPVFHVM